MFGWLYIQSTKEGKRRWFQKDGVWRRIVKRTVEWIFCCCINGYLESKGAPFPNIIYGKKKKEKEKE